MRKHLRRRDAPIRYSAALAAAAAAAMLAHSLPQHETNPVFGFLFIGVLAVTWYFGWRPGLATLLFGTVGMFSLSLNLNELARGLRPGMAVRIVSNWVVCLVTIFAVNRIRILERRHSLMLRHDRLLVGRQQKAMTKLQEQVQLTAYSNERLAIALQAGSSGMFEAKREPEIIRWSAELASLHGLPREGREMSYGEWLELVHPDDRQSAHRAIQSSLQSGELSGEWRIVRKDTGELRWLSSRGKVTFGPGGAPVRMIGIATDITEQKLAEEALIRSEKLASVGRMAASVAHEINNPLESVVNAVYIALLDANLAAQTRKALDTAEYELKRIAHLTRQTLGFYHESMGPSMFDVSVIVDEVVDLFAPKFKQKQLSVDVQLGSGCSVNAVAGELRHVVSSLVLNAIDASNAGGGVKIRSHRLSLGGKRWVRVTIADQGSGIAKEDIKKIFEPFFTTRQNVGTGLGLWVSSEIVQRHSGRIRVKSCPRRGSVFCVFFPAPEGADGKLAS